MNEKISGLLSFNAVMRAMSLPGREAMLERSFALQIGGKLDYKEAFENTPEPLIGNIVRQFKFWHDELSPEEQNSFFLLANNATFTKDFIEYLCNENPEIERLFDEAPQALRTDVSAFLAMRCYDVKIEVAKQGKPAFFCADGQRVAIFRMFAKSALSLGNGAPIDIMHSTMSQDLETLFRSIGVRHGSSGDVGYTEC